MIYLDTSGAIKLVRPEAHSDHLSHWLGERLGTPVVSSVLIEVELMRATRRSAPERAGHAADVLRGIGAVTVSPSVIARAAGYTDPDLRSLDAIHLATAEHVVFVTHEILEAFVA
ncbi:MAG: type II toxin-antitoxin system VapC family toxin, partial [Acidimicrobiales bacterium]